MGWIASLGGTVQPKTIKSYLTHVRSMHVDADLPFSAVESPMVQRLIRGIKRYHGERDRKPKMPITLPILQQLLRNLSPGHAAYHSIYAACCVAYSGLLRCGEFTVHDSNKFSPEVNLAGMHVTFVPNFNTATHVIVSLPASKTDPFRKGISIHLSAAPNLITCPVAALKRLFASRPGGHNTYSPEAPLFTGSDGLALTRNEFISAIRSALTAAGLNAALYSGHSFRRGAASSAASAGCSDYEIQLLGRWRSDAYKLYIDMDSARQLYLSYSLHLAVPHSGTYEPPFLPTSFGSD
jgi:hypothetical protein